MRLTILGSGVCEPTLKRGSSAYAVEVGEDLLLLDMGSGAVRSALAAGLDPRRARHLLLSHFHPDHTADLVPFLFACSYAEEWRPAAPLHFHGPPGLGRFLESLEVPYRWVRPRGWTRLLHEDPAVPLRGEGWSARAFPVSHGGESAVAWRIEAGDRALCYSGDSSFCEGLLEAARGVDLLLCECSVPGGEPPVEGHLRAEEVGRLASQARVGRVLLTHLYPVADRVDLVAQVRSAFPGPVGKAEDGATHHL